MLVHLIGSEFRELNIDRMAPIVCNDGQTRMVNMRSIDQQRWIEEYLTKASAARLIFFILREQDHEKALMIMRALLCPLKK